MAKRLSRDPADRRAAEIRAVVDLLDDAERSRAADRLGLATDATADALTECLAGSSRADTLRALVAAAPDVVEMLKDITGCLEQHGVSARTTGFILALEESPSTASIDLSPQEIELVCSWPTRLESFGAKPFAQLRRDWKAISALWSDLVDKAYPRQIKRSLDVARSSVLGEEVRRRPRDATDLDARLVLAHLLDRLTRTIEVLERIQTDARPADVELLLKALKRDGSAASEALHAGKPVRATRPRELDRLLKHHRRLNQKLARFEEDVRALAVLNEAAEQDLLRYDLWRKRPQLFEIWILTSVLHWMTQRGYDVELLQVKATAGGRQRWELSYANAKKPCASVGPKGPEGRTDYVFYQLRRPGGKGADDMPDISLLASSSPKDDAIWAIDPKHSDRRSYRLRDYQGTGSRYVKSFGASLALIVEYYPREDLPEENPYELDDDALLVKDASPHGTGLPIILEQLAPVHLPLQRTVLCIDMSSSFDDHRTAALDALRSAIAAEGATLADAFVWFAGSACQAKGAAVFITHATLPDPPPLDPGTSLQALVEALRSLVTPGVNRIAIVGDGEFDNAAWQEDLKRSLGVSVVRYA
jgi:hypothetical protein